MILVLSDNMIFGVLSCEVLKFVFFFGFEWPCHWMLVCWQVVSKLSQWSTFRLRVRHRHDTSPTYL